MKQATIAKILKYYGVEFSNILPPQKGYRNESYRIITPNSTDANLIIYKSESDILNRIINANTVSDFLTMQGIPARSTLTSKIIRISAPGFEQYGALYKYLPGQTIPWEAYTKIHIKLLGKTLSNIHSRLRIFNFPLPEAADEYISINNRVSQYFTNPGVQKAMKDKLKLTLVSTILGQQKKILVLSKNLPNQQVLHMDFVRGNILFSTQITADSEIAFGGIAVSGILDFEKTAYGHPVYDIARSLAFLLVDCKYKQEKKVRKYFLLSGYQKKGRQSFKYPVINYNNQKFNMLENLINIFLLYDFYKFLKHNPYEFLERNEHFTRTRDLLINRRILMLK